MFVRTPSVLAIAALILSVGCKKGDVDVDWNADDDGDGITNGDERDLGTNPNEADSDGDGVDDADEWRDGTNPNYEFSHSYTGDYRVGYCDTPPATTGPTMDLVEQIDGTTYEYGVLQNGDVPDNFTMMDQHGEELDLYSFCGQPVMVVLSAGWCGPCRSEAETLQAVADAYPDLQIISVLTNNNTQGQRPDLAFIQSWANQYRFENVAAVMPSGSAPTTYEEVFAQPHMAWEMDGYIPTIYHLDETLTVISADEGLKEPPAI